MTLRKYFESPFFAFSYVNKEGELVAIQEEYKPETHGDWTPKTPIVDSLPQFNAAPNGASNVLRSSLPPVPLIPASELVRVDESEYEVSQVPKKVRRHGLDPVIFFKAGFKGHGLLREMDLLTQINHSGKFEAPFRTSTLVGLVVWDHEPALMGLLLEFIDGVNMDWLIGNTPIEDKKKWCDQVDATVRQLHDVGIVWGDAKTNNVIINADGDAVVVDFGGGCKPESILKEHDETAHGDLVGLIPMRAEMGL